MTRGLTGKGVSPDHRPDPVAHRDMTHRVVNHRPTALHLQRARYSDA